MRRGSACMVAALLVLAGCSGEGGDSSGVPVERITAGFETLADVIVVHAVDRLPLRSVDLLAPDGERVPAYSLDVASSPQVPPSLGEAELMSTPGAVKRVTRIDTMVSIALIRLPDPEQYTQTWPQWRIMLSLGDPGSGSRQVMLAAPKPR